MSTIRSTESLTERHSQRRYDHQMAVWLLLCAAVIFGMIVLGGVTRLTSSGLSMVEWRPLMGIIPPLGDAQWQEVFKKYQQFPEYQQINLGMSLDEFKSIFMYEYLHRVLGRLIGMLYFFPMLYFMLRRQVRAGMHSRLITLFVMGALQGLLGWYMVKSGLVDDPRVSAYRLTAHLGLAVLIFAAMLWVAFDLLFTDRQQASAGSGIARFSRVLVGLVYLMILSGGLVAGTRAGFAFNTWPLMGTSFVPNGLYSMSPMWRSIFEDIVTVQFNHRIFAYILLVLLSGAVFVALRGACQNGVKSGAWLVLTALILQVVLGITTLLLHVPVALAAAHQAGAILLLTSVIYFAHRLSKSRASPSLS